MDNSAIPFPTLGVLSVLGANPFADPFSLTFQEESPSAKKNLGKAVGEATLAMNENRR